MNDVINICATYGMQGIALGMMFYLCCVTISRNTQAILKLEKTLYTHELMTIKKELRNDQCQNSGE